MLVPEQDSKSAGRVSTLSNACCVRRAPRQSIIDGECNDVCIRYRGLAGALLKPVVAPESRPYRRLITSTCPGRSRFSPRYRRVLRGSRQGRTSVTQSLPSRPVSVSSRRCALQVSLGCRHRDLRGNRLLGQLGQVPGCCPTFGSTMCFVSMRFVVDWRDWHGMEM